MINRYASLRQGLVGAWCPSVQRCGSGFQLPDLSGYGNNGTLTNMDPGTDWVASGGKGALDFDGSNDNVSLGTSTTIGKAGDKTLSIWTFLRELNRYQAIVSCWESDAASFELFVDVLSSRITGGFYASTGFVVSATASTNIWQHWIVKQSGSVYELYRNGVLVSTATNGTRTGTTTATAVFGQRQNNFFFNGQLDDIRTYNRALTPSEIQLLYTGGRGVGLAPERIKHRRKTTAAATFKAAWARRQQHIGSGVY